MAGCIFLAPFRRLTARAAPRGVERSAELLKRERRPVFRGRRSRDMADPWRFQPEALIPQTMDPGVRAKRVASYFAVTFLIAVISHPAMEACPDALGWAVPSRLPCWTMDCSKVTK